MKKMQLHKKLLKCSNHQKLEEQIGFWIGRSKSKKIYFYITQTYLFSVGCAIAFPIVPFLTAS